MASIAFTQSPVERRSALRRTAAGVAAAHDAHLHRSLATARWERRGVLGRLVRLD